MAMKGAEQEKRYVVLVIENHPLILRLTWELLGYYGFDALKAGNTNEAVEILEGRDDIFAIFTEVDLPGSMEGLQLAHAVRIRCPHICIILTSSRRTLDDQDVPVGSHVCMKPYRIEHIIKILHDFAA